MKVAVSGASGVIGSALVPALRAAGHDVVTLVRREPAAPGEIAWNPAAGDLDASALGRIDVAIGLSGANIGERWTNARRREIRDSRLDTTGLLAQTLSELDPRPRALLVAGAAGIYGDRGDEILTEESELGAGFLADLGRAWEAAADPAREAGIRVVHFRQGIVLSQGKGGAVARMLPFFKLGLGGRVGSGKQWWSWVALDDVVRAYEWMLTSDLEGAVNLTSPNPVTNVQFTTALGRAVHRPTIFPLPAFGVKTLFGEMGETMLLEGQRVLPERLLTAGFGFSHPEIDEALTHALAR